MAWGVPNTRPIERQPFMQLLHSTDGCQYPELLVPLYTAPTPRKPLSDEEIALIVGECAASAHRHDDFSFARAIEKAHGIKEQEHE